MQQQGDGFGLGKVGLGVDFDALIGDAELRLLDDDAVDPHPAAADELLGFAARTAPQFGDAFGKADGFGHGGRTCGWSREFTPDWRRAQHGRMAVMGMRLLLRVPARYAFGPINPIAS